MQNARRSSAETSQSSLPLKAGRISRATMPLRTDRVVSAILAPSSQLSAHSLKVFATARRCFPLFLHDRRPAFTDGMTGVQQLFPRQRQRDAPSTIATDCQRFSPPVNAVVVSKGNGACRRYHDIHAVTVSDLVQSPTGLKVAKCRFGEHRFGFSWLGRLFAVINHEASRCPQIRMPPSFLAKFLPSMPDCVADRLSSRNRAFGAYRPLYRHFATHNGAAVFGIIKKSASISMTYSEMRGKENHLDHPRKSLILL